jgi:hypothetical protein
MIANRAYDAFEPKIYGPRQGSAQNPYAGECAKYVITTAWRDFGQTRSRILEAYKYIVVSYTR